MRLFLTQDAKAGFALKGDDVVSVFSTQKDGAAHLMLLLAIQAGGRRLDAFDSVLPKIYAPNGFVATSRTVSAMLRPLHYHAAPDLHLNGDVNYLSESNRLTDPGN